MSTAIKTVEQMKILHDMGTGLLNRLYHLKGWFISKRKPQCLADPELSKVRARLEKKFPAPPAAEKVRFTCIRSQWISPFNLNMSLLHRLLGGTYSLTPRPERYKSYKKPMISF